MDTATSAPRRRPIFASLAILLALLQLLALWWILGSGGDQFVEEVIRTANVALLILAPIVWAAMGLGIFVLGLAFLGIALWRRERPFWVLWLAGGLLLLAPLILALGDSPPPVSLTLEFYPTTV